jgi:hypothetical protein
MEGSGEGNEGRYFATPIFIFYNNQYSDIPICYNQEEGIEREMEANEQRNCELVERIIKPNLVPEKNVYVLENGSVAGTIKLKKTSLEIQFIDNYAEIDLLPRSGMLTNNPRVNSTGMINIMENPFFTKRNVETDQEFFYEDTLLMTLDIDGDSYPEMIYKCDAFWGPFYRVFSFKNGKWDLVLETEPLSAC